MFMEGVFLKEKTLKKKDHSSKLMKGFLLPSVIVVAIVTQIPFVMTIIFSFFKYNLKKPDQFGFAGLDNFIKVFKTGDFYIAFTNFLIMTVSSVIICTILGMIFALLLNRSFLGVNIVRTLIIMPMFVMDAVIGVIWTTLMLNPSFGINGILSNLIGVAPIEFISSYPLETVVLLIVWQWTPLFVLVFLAGFQSIPTEIEDSAKVDGASTFRKFFAIDLPIMKYHFQVAIMLGLVFILKVFGLIYVATAGGPGVASTNLPFFAYRISFYRWDVGMASSVAFLTVVVSLILLIGTFRILQKRMGEN